MGTLLYCIRMRGTSPELEFPGVSRERAAVPCRFWGGEDGNFGWQSGGEGFIMLR